MRLHVDGEPLPLPRTLDLSAYRIVQEGLTNALKHAHASQADVVVRYEPGELRDRRPRRRRRRRRRATASGHGLVGVRERVKIYGGEMTAGARGGGGFVLSTRLPLDGRGADDASASSSPTTSRWSAPASACCSRDEPDIEVVAEASNGRDAVRQAARFDPTVVLMDIRMPELDGLEATRRILAADPHARVLILTTFDLDEYVYEALSAGASGFVLKDDPPEQLIAAIRTVAAGDALLSPAVTKRVIRQFARIPRPEPPAGLERAHRARARGLPPASPGGLSNAEIAQELFISETTVKTHVTHVLQKLDLRDRVQAVVLAYRTGLFENDLAPHAHDGFA